MVLGNLGKSLRESLRKIARAGYVDKGTLEDTVKEIQRALLASDINVKLVFKLSENIKKRAWEEKPKPGLSKKEHMVNIVYEELSTILAGKIKPEKVIEPVEAEKGEVKGKLKGKLKGKVKAKKVEKKKIMLVGLFGSGKTTTCAKLGKYLSKSGLKVSMIGTDVWRPAAFEQLKQLGEEVNIPVYGGGKKDPAKILKKALDEAKGFDVVIVDSAGRDAIDKELSKELKDIDKVLKPDERFLVMPADLGQKAADLASNFNKIVKLEGVILTKLDSSAKGGGALSACSALGIPIKFVGLGEKIDDFEEFRPMKFVSKLLGMGDIESLVKKTEEIFEGTSKDQMEALMKGKFTLKDLYAQIQGMKKMGPLKKVMEMLPLGSMGIDVPDAQLKLSQGRMEKFVTVMDSMTPYELENPDVLDSSRVKRIASGSGSKVEDVRGLLKHYNMTKKMVKRFGKNKRSMEKMMKKFGGMKKMKGM